MRGLLHRPKRNKTNLVRLAHFLNRPANAHVTRQSPAPIGRPFKGGNGGGHLEGLMILLDVSLSDGYEGVRPAADPPPCSFVLPKLDIRY